MQTFFANSALKRWSPDASTSPWVKDLMKDLCVIFECHGQSQTQTNREMHAPSLCHIELSCCDDPADMTAGQLAGQNWVELAVTMYSAPVVNASFAYCGSKGVMQLAELLWDLKIVSTPTLGTSIMSVLRVAAAQLSVTAGSMLEDASLMAPGVSPLLDLFTELGGVPEQQLMLAYIDVCHILAAIVDPQGAAFMCTDLVSVLFPLHGIYYMDNTLRWLIPIYFADGRPIGGLFKAGSGGMPRMRHLIDMMRLNLFGAHLRSSKANTALVQEYLKLTEDTVALTVDLLVRTYCVLHTHIFQARPLKPTKVRVGKHGKLHKNAPQCKHVGIDTRSKSGQQALTMIDCAIAMIYAWHGEQDDDEEHTCVAVGHEKEGFLPLRLLREQGVSIQCLHALHWQSMAHNPLPFAVGDQLECVGSPGGDCTVDVDMSHMRDKRCVNFVVGERPAVLLKHVDTDVQFLVALPDEGDVDEDMWSWSEDGPLWSVGDVTTVDSVHWGLISLMNGGMILNYNAPDNYCMPKCFLPPTAVAVKEGWVGWKDEFAPAGFGGGGGGGGRGGRGGSSSDPDDDMPLVVERMSQASVDEHCDTIQASTPTID